MNFFCLFFHFQFLFYVLGVAVRIKQFEPLERARFPLPDHPIGPEGPSAEHNIHFARLKTNQQPKLLHASIQCRCKLS